MGKEIFAQRLKQLRARRNISTRHLARELGYNSSFSIVSLESGESFPSVEKLINLARYFNVSTDYLLGIEQ